MAKVFGKEFTKKELFDRTGSFGTIAGVRTITYEDGFAQGLKAYEVTNGPLRFTVYIDKCMDIGEVYYNGLPIHYQARPGVMNNEWFHDGHDAPRSIMCGMMFTCGLSNVGPYQVMPNGQTQPQHGRIRSTPAYNYGARTYWKNDDFFIELTGSMRESSLFGTNLVLHRTITTKLGSTDIVINDVIENESSTKDVPFMIMYHCNSGFPFLDKNAKTIIDPIETKCRDKVAEDGLKEESPFVFGDPILGYEEQVFYHTQKADKDGMCHASIINEEKNVKLTVSYSQKEIPNLIQWKCKDAGNYVMALEPSNCYPEGVIKQEQINKLRKLAPNEVIENKVIISVTDAK